MDESEKLLASVSDCLSASSQAYNLFTNADLTFPNIMNKEGNIVELLESEYLIYITSKNRAEFELYTHEQIEEGNPLTADDLCKYWHSLNKQYFGPDMIVDEEIDMEWARINDMNDHWFVYRI